MPFQIIWEPRGVHCVFYGAITAQDVLNVSLEVVKDSRFDDLRYWIINYSEVTDFQYDRSEMEKVIELRLSGFSTNPRMQLAFVIADERLRKYLPSRTTQYPYKVFSIIKEARAWVSVADRNKPQFSLR